MKQPLIGARLKNIKLSCFVRHGIPVPTYAINGELLLLFKNNQECLKYVHLLEAIKNEMDLADLAGNRSHIQAARVFLNELIEVLNCD